MLKGLGVVLCFVCTIAISEAKEFREIIVIADSHENREFLEQKAIFAAGGAEFDTRRIKVTYQIEEGHPFVVALFGLDGERKYQDTTVVSVKQICDIVDSMPMRKMEIERELNSV